MFPGSNYRSPKGQLEARALCVQVSGSFLSHLDAQWTLDSTSAGPIPAPLYQGLHLTETNDAELKGSLRLTALSWLPGMMAS